MLLIYEHYTAPSKWWPRWDRKSVDDHGSTKSEDEPLFTKENTDGEI